MKPAHSAPFQRSLFTDGTLLTAAGLRLQQEYDSSKRRLMNRRFFGWGILSGFTLHTEGEELLLEPGFALTQDGRELLLEQPLRIPLSQLDFSALPPAERSGFLCLEYQETEAGNADRCSPEMDPLGTVPDRVLESFRLAVRPSHPEPELSLARCLLSEESGSLRIHQVIPLSPIFHPAGAYREKSAGRLDLPLQARHSNLGVVYSPPIQHGLGSGAADIRLAVQGWQDGSPCWVSGEAGLFGAPIQTAVKQNPTEGSFVIAVRSRDPLLQTVRIQWTAQKVHFPDEPECVPLENMAFPQLTGEFPSPPDGMDPAAEPNTLPSPAAVFPAPMQEEAPSFAPVSGPALHASGFKLKVSPEVANLKPGEQVQFCPLLSSSDPPAAFSFRVRDLDGGSIDEQGVYTAPPHEGFFQIEVFRQNCPRQYAFVYALVRT